ncbi:myopalladin-like isoform X2 [Liolophura sinensis]|uniref:myopalladin-like isoform X2 n=1 Tax=Liolophura sinensis TaxID=3198878 RepID=UPI003158CF14
MPTHRPICAARFTPALTFAKKKGCCSYPCARFRHFLTGPSSPCFPVSSSQTLSNMADVESDEDRYKNVDVDSILSRVERRPLTFTRKRSLCQAPEFLKRLTGEDTIEEGGSLRLECKVVGFPKPTLRWFHDEEEITNNERYTFECLDDNCYTISIPLVSKCDEASYKCKAENKEGYASSLLFVHVKGKSGSKSPKKSKSDKSPSRRTVSFPPLIPTIVERIVEEEKAEAELENLPPSPLTSLYDGVTMKQKNTRPQFLGDWAFVKDVVKNNHTATVLSVCGCFVASYVFTRPSRSFCWEDCITVRF